jgi:exosome complex component RRP45
MARSNKGEKVSLNERDFLVASLAEGRRLDGRGLYDYRTLKISFPYQPGYCEVQLGHTRVYVVVRCEVVEPFPDRPTEGFFLFNTEFSPMASQSFEVGGRVSEEAVEVGRLIERSLRDSRAIDTEALCIRAGEKVWAVQIDVHVLDDGGNLIDAASIATVAALLHFRRPDITITGDAITVHSVADREPVPLSIHHLPICVTFAVFGDGDQVVVDPWWKEEQGLAGRVTLIHNQHRELCGIHKAGGPGLPLNTLVKCSKIAAVKVQDIVQAIQTAIAAQPPTPTAIPRPFHIVAPNAGEIVPPPTTAATTTPAAPAPITTATTAPTTTATTTSRGKPFTVAAASSSSTTPTTPAPAFQFQKSEMPTLAWDDEDDGATHRVKEEEEEEPASAVDSFLADARKGAARRVVAMDEETKEGNGENKTTKPKQLQKEVITVADSDEEEDSDGEEEEETMVVHSSFAKQEEEKKRKDAEEAKRKEEAERKERERKEEEEKSRVATAKPLPANDLSVAIKKKKKASTTTKKTTKK